MTLENILESFLLPGLLSSDPAAAGGRWLQQMNIPNYTSPPLEDAIQATPEAYRSDDVMDAARAAAAAGNCTADGNRCHIPFSPPREIFEASSSSSKVGVIFYCGGLVDPRAYSPIAHVSHISHSRSLFLNHLQQRLSTQTHIITFSISARLLPLGTDYQLFCPFLIVTLPSWDLEQLVNATRDALIWHGPNLNLWKSGCLPGIL